MRFLPLILLASLSFAETRYIPHVTSSSGTFETTLLLNNAFYTDQTVVLQGFKADGSAFDEVTIDLQSREQQTLSVTETLGDEVASIMINGSDHVTVSVNYQAKVEGSAPANIRAQKPSWSWRIIPGNWAETWDGFAAINLGPTPTTIYVRQVSLDGVVLEQATLPTINPMGKTIAALHSLFDQTEDVYYELYTADFTSISVTALRGNQSSTLLWENYAQPNSLSKLLLGVWDVFVVKNGERISERLSISSLALLDGEEIAFGMDSQGNNVQAQFNREFGFHQVWIFTEDVTKLYQVIIDDGEVDGCYFELSDGSSTDCANLGATILDYSTAVRTNKRTITPERPEAGSPLLEVQTR